MKNPYHLQQIKITKIEELTPDTRLFSFNFSYSKFTPGQFLMLSLPGHGEAPFGIMQPACASYHLQLLIRKVGSLTNKIFDLKKGDDVFVRGPLGSGFPINSWKKKNIAMFAGGTGIVPIKALVDFIGFYREYFKEIQIFYGAKTPENIFFQKELNIFQKFAEVMLTSEKFSKNWEGNIGLVTNLITSKTVFPDNTVAVLCGPPIMYKFVIEKLKKLGFQDKDIYLSLERRIRCGIGKCQHCTCGDKYVCLDGPVFSYNEVLKMPDGI